MPKITLLDQNTINKIAAGEVIERPAAVAKELIENAIDAGATAITVEIKEGGIRFLRITDNGSGIAKDEIPLAFQRHSTSKIKSVEDLLTVSSLGFRGEALSSISAVAQVELITKTPEALTGTRYIIDGGVEKDCEEIGCPDGTTFVVRNLFFHTPARRKFLKSPTTEAGYISDLVERLAVSHPNISFKFRNNEQLKLHTSGNDKLKDIIYHVYGREITTQLLAISKEQDLLGISGFIGKPIVSRGNRNYMNYFINGRYIKSNIVNKAIEDAYKPYSMTHRYPFTVLHFTIASKYIDVNVHPTKMEIRFTNEEAIYQLIFTAISDTLKGRELIPEVSFSEKEEKKEKDKNISIPEPFEKNRIYAEQKKELQAKTDKPLQNLVQEEGNYSISLENKNLSLPHEQIKEKNEAHTETNKTYAPSFYETKKATMPSISLHPEEDNQNRNKIDAAKEMKKLDKEINASAAQLNLFEHPLLSKEAKKQHKIIGQIFDTYWIVEYDKKMFLIDQHAAHEKVLFERTMKDLKEKEFSSQMLQPPIILSLSMREEETLKQYKESLEKLGFEIEEFGGKEYSVRAVPADLFGIAQVDLLLQLIDNLVEENHIKSPNLILEKVASMSCKAAVKGKQKLSFPEVEALIDYLLELENPYHCPHGRPVIISMSQYELEKKFKRIV